MQSEIDERMESYARNWKYNKIVFMLLPWLEIYETDSERNQDWERAVLTFEKMCETYKTFGYDIVEVPKVLVSDRADFILKFIKEKQTQFPIVFYYFS
nr:AAA family ATPase [uncultured Salegentibacter sp.]